MSDEVDNSLRDDSSAREVDARYTTVRVLKESEQGRTELVEDANGKRFIRKYLDGDWEAEDQYEALSHIDDDGVPRVITHYRLGDDLVVIMQYIEGVTLRKSIENNGPFSQEEALRVVEQLCHTLTILHNLSPTPLIHRDIKPSNVVLSTKGAVLIDFAIARRFNPDASQDTHLWGTRGYAAPEQFGFGQSDQRTDVYAMGMLLYFMLTGHDPEPSLQKTLPQKGLSSEAVQVISACIALDPNERLASAREVASLAHAKLSPAPAELKHISPIRTEAAQSQKSPAVSEKKPKHFKRYRRLLDENRWMPKSLNARRAFRAWVGTATAITAFMVFVFVFDAIAGFIKYALSDAWVAAARDVSFLVIVWMPLYELCTNMGNIASRIPPRGHPVVQVIVAIVIMLVLIVVFSLVENALEGMFSAAYLAAQP